MSSYSSGIVTGLSVAAAKIKAAAGEIACGADPMAIMASLYQSIVTALKAGAAVKVASDE